jgi:hypothetical protein
VAEGMSRIPCDLTTAQCTALTQYFSPSEIEWIVLSVGMMGFLNKFMDAVGVELEAKSMRDVAALLTPIGWVPGKHARSDVDLSQVSTLPQVDNLGTYVRVIRQLPAAIQLENSWTKDVPDRWLGAGNFLEQRTGYRFPLLGKLQHRRAIRTLTTVLRDNLDPTQSEIGLGAKCLVGLVYATVVENETLAAEARLLAARLAPELDGSIFCAVVSFAAKPLGKNVTDIDRAISELSALPILSDRDVAAILLARAASTSPAEIDAAILSQVSSRLTNSSIVELIVWLSIQQLLHRVGCFYAVTSSDSNGDDLLQRTATSRSRP